MTEPYLPDQHVAALRARAEDVEGGSVVVGAMVHGYVDGSARLSVMVDVSKPGHAALVVSLVQGMLDHMRVRYPPFVLPRAVVGDLRTAARALSGFADALERQHQGENMPSPEDEP